MRYLSILKNCITGSSNAKTFYLYLIHKHSHYNMGSHSSLLSRSIKVCDEYNTSFLQFMCIDSYARICKSKITALSPTNGLIDFITTLLPSFNDHTRHRVKLLIFLFYKYSYTHYYYNSSHHIFTFLLHTTVIIYLFYFTATLFFII